MEMEARLLEKGYKIWERTDCNEKHYKRIYINDFSKYLDIEDKGIDKSGVKYLVVNGIDFSDLKRCYKKIIVAKVQGGGFTVYYDCEKKKFIYQSNNLKKELEKKEEQIEETKEEEKMTKEEIKQEINFDDLLDKEVVTIANCEDDFAITLIVEEE